MSATAASPVKRSRWLDWSPKTPISADLAGSEPTKPTKPGFEGFVGAGSGESSEIDVHTAGAALAGGSGFVGFVGAASAESPKIDAQPEPAERSRAAAVLNRAGVRLMQLDAVVTVGIWSDLDGPEIRKALRALGSHHLPVRYLDGAGVPTRYRLRRVAGEPVPGNVLAEMERQPKAPWKVRDRMLQEMGWGPEATSWAQGKAAALNRLFHEQGVTGRPGRITAATVLHGEGKRSEQIPRRSSR